MGCRCAERAAALRQTASALRQGNTGAITRNLAFVARTLVEDTRSGALRQQAAMQLARLKGIRR